MVSITIDRKARRATIQLYLFSEDRHSVVWLQHITREGRALGTGWFVVRTREYRSKPVDREYRPKHPGYGQVMRERILRLRSQYLKRTGKTVA